MEAKARAKQEKSECEKKGRGFPRVTVSRSHRPSRAPTTPHSYFRLQYLSALLMTTPSFTFSLFLCFESTLLTSITLNSNYSLLQV